MNSINLFAIISKKDVHYLITAILLLIVCLFSQSYATSISDHWKPRVWTEQWSPMQGQVQIIPDPAYIWNRDSGATYDPISVMPSDISLGSDRPTVTNGGQTIPYTYYIDSNAPNCTDSAKGTTTTPRCSFPEGKTLVPGDVVVVAYGTHVGFNWGTDGGSGPVEGSPSNPIFIWGMCNGNYNARQKDNDCPVLTAPARHQSDLFAQHVIIDGFELTPNRLRIGHYNTDVGTVNGGYLHDTKFVTIRNVHSHNNEKNGFQYNANYVICYRCKADHFQRGDSHGFTPGRSQYVWTLQSESSYNSGDGMQWCHSAVDCTEGEYDPYPKYHYTDQSDFHHNRENGWDLKFVEHAVLSRSRIWGHIGAKKDTPWCYEDEQIGTGQFDSACPINTSGSDGSGVILGSNGCLGTSEIGAQDIWIIYNEFLDNFNHVRFECGNNAHVIGNKFLQNNLAKYPYIINNDALNSGITSIGDAKNTMIIGNLFTNSKRGLSKNNQQSTSYNAENNIFYNVDAPFTLGNDVNSTAECANNCVFRNNIVFHEKGFVTGNFVSNNEVEIRQTSDLNGLLQNMRSEAVGNIWGNPLFTNSPADNYHLTSQSPAIDAASPVQLTLSPTLNNDSNVSDLSLAADFEGNLLPSNNNIDIGPYQVESGSGPVSSQPEPPSNFGVTKIIQN